MRTFVDRLRDDARARFDTLHESVSDLYFADFPDHTNIGDSAIALGEFAYWRHAGIKVIETHPGPSTPDRLLSGAAPVAFQGGGSFGGLYPPMDDLRLKFVSRLDPSVAFIQLPQSVHFASPMMRDRYQAALTDRKLLRVAVRDHQSVSTLARMGVDALLSPDAVHHLGSLDSPDPQSPMIVLARTDPESRDGRTSQVLQTVEHIDWDPGSLARRAVHYAKFRFGIPELLKPMFPASSAHWERVARRRLEAGIRRLSVGETIVTDRLHAMLLGLQMGRRIVAVDSSTKKLGAYASTWLAASDVPLEFADGFGEALRIARRGRTL